MNDHVWLEQARALVKKYGQKKARQICIKHRNDSSPGTASYAFHNATLKYIDQIPWDCQCDYCDWRRA